MGRVADVLIRCFIASLFGIAIFTGFLHPAYAEENPFMVMVCSCGKPSYFLSVTKEDIKLYMLPQTKDLTAACRSKEPIFRGALVLRTESVTKEPCPLSI